MTLTRLGLVAYLNSEPIGYGLVHGRQRGRFEIVSGAPAELADALAAGTLDLALLPSFEYARLRGAGRDVAIVPRIGISAFGPSRSVLLFSKRPPSTVESVAVDRSSRTLTALLRLLFLKRFRLGAPQPALVPSPPDLPSMLERCDAALLIGDPALLASRRHPELAASLTVIDLAEEWRSMTGLPFVFAFWAGARREDSAAIVGALADSLEEGLTMIPEIVRSRAAGDAGLAALLHGYLTSSIRFGLGRDELRGVETFYALMVAEGLLAGPPPALVFHPTEACLRVPR